MLPHYLSIGMTAREFFHSTPRVLKAYDKAELMKLERTDQMVHAMVGSYVMSAVSVAVEHCLVGRRARSEYVKEPLLKEVSIDEDEKIRRRQEEFEKALDAWESAFKAAHPKSE